MTFGHVDQAVPLVTDAAPCSRSTIVVAGYGDVEVLHGVSLHAGQGHGRRPARRERRREVDALCGHGRRPAWCPPAAPSASTGATSPSLAPFQRRAPGVMLAPEARGIFPGLSVEENLEVLLRSTPSSGRQAYERFPILGAAAQADRRAAVRR